MRTKIRQVRSDRELVEKSATIKGWVRTVRKQKTFAFVEVNDGSCLGNLQVVMDADLPGYQEILEDLTTGCSVAVEGTVLESPGKGQALELKASSIEVIGSCDAESYPLQKKRHSFEFLRSIAHLRPRTNVQGAVARIRNTLAYATHQFFQKKSFLYVHTPIITASDCEGAGEMFQVTTLPQEQKNGKVDPNADFFHCPTFLTVSGQLNGESYACALSDIYTFGPTFRAENSNTSRHLAEFWMIEPEMAFADNEDNMCLAEEYIKYCLGAVFKGCEEDLGLFDKFVSKGIRQRLQDVYDQPFQRLSYTEAVDILEKSGKKFEYPVGWGKDLQSEHERFLAEEHFKKPLIVHDYPKEKKAFYMRENEDGKTVAAMDVLVPGVGEIIGGSQREERLPMLEQKLEAFGLSKEVYWWYLELRKYGSVPHAGFGLGFERLVQFVTGMENVRDVIPFPRFPGNASF